MVNDIHVSIESSAAGLASATNKYDGSSVIGFSKIAGNTRSRVLEHIQTCSFLILVFSAFVWGCYEGKTDEVSRVVRVWSKLRFRNSDH